MDAAPTIVDAGPRERTDAGATSVGCEASTRLAVPDEPEARGPWPVGVRTVTVGRLTVDVWYPAQLGSETGVAPATYDVRDWLPESQRGDAVIPDADAPIQTCDCHRDLPIDAEHGPYPLVVFVHGTAAFRTQSLSFLTHWASRGFVVVATDHPGLYLGDLLAIVCADPRTGPRMLEEDVDAMLDAMRATSGELAWLAGRVDPARIGLAGHSAGGIVTSLSDRAGVRVVIGLSSNGAAREDPGLEGSLFVAATDDAVVPYSSTLSAYEGSPEPKWFLGIQGSGHLAPSDLCDLENEEGQNLLAVAQEHGVCGAQFAGMLFDCQPDHVDPEDARVVGRAITTAVLEQILWCADRSAAITAIPERLEHVEELRSAP
ncbi:Putative lipoprotein signal peptide [Sandaracinus amylolyticus]|uniref:Putative lipoprotein signal peptide n=1 Tax=Sandaracinus amylolyticus TaxID=927083 RepID=A0A0F6W0X0_9BACT|nr:Putative lipoprotein signal peptide [Sandaracinus amylolyticus]